MQDEDEGKVVPLRMGDVVNDAPPYVVEDFADAPKTIGELRVGRTNRSDHWRPEDALIDLLRAIQSGEKRVESIMIIEFDEREDEASGEVLRDYRYTMAGPRCGTFMLGVLERIKQALVTRG